MESWSKRLIEFASNGYEFTKDSIKSGIEKVKDPEFQNSVKEKVKNAATKTKEVKFYFISFLQFLQFLYIINNLTNL